MQVTVASMQISLKVARDRKGWTLERLATESGVNKSTISRIERSEVEPMHATVIALEDALELKRGSLKFGQRAVA